ncbi:hypothetical protein C498_06660 [Haloferax volcanii DS2]|uniref:Uncharacterized protein n=1 Tax=Haloferax volcanii (strain ATCC 29605 / DSM 3757 / JCM 8879 / NBRC 14742 / NCIMB 2012 / VKM B-1768 / DS2) TaxID=309800 RepID=L9V8K0_HALVD|nr:hypothetical protein C498_06660 [Haloferax volcanii DS2]
MQELGPIEIAPKYFLVFENLIKVLSIQRVIRACRQCKEDSPKLMQVIKKLQLFPEIIFNLLTKFSITICQRIRIPPS